MPLSQKIKCYNSQRMDPALGRFTTIDPHAENYYAWSPYSYVGNNPLRYIDPTGMDWYSYEVEEADENGEMQTRLEYRFHEQRLSNKEMKNLGYTNHLGKVHFSENTYFALEGGTTNTSDYMATINAMTEDFGKMGTGDARDNMSKAESYLSGIGWNSELPTTIGLGTEMFVAPFSTDNYTKLTDKSLKREFDTEYQSQREARGLMNNRLSPITDTRFLDAFVGIAGPPPLLIPFTPSPQKVINQATANHSNKLIRSYTKFNIIR